MRAGLLRLVALLLPFVLVACADLPTAPLAVPSDKPLASCYERSDGTIYCDPISPIWDECDPWTRLDWCRGGDGDCMTTARAADPGAAITQGCPPGGEPSPEPPGTGPGDEEPPPGDTCQTGDPALDSPEVRQGLENLWIRSNPDAPQAQRLEEAAWIIQRSDGSFGMAQFNVSTQSPCGVNGNLNAPAGAVAWAHTHPFTAGEVQYICGSLKEPDPATGGWRDIVGPDGQPVYPVYDNRPSFPDREVMDAMNRVRSQRGQNLIAGVIIDANQTTVYSENPGEGTTTFPRCGY